MTHTPPFLPGTINIETGEIISPARKEQQPLAVNHRTVPPFIAEPEDPRSPLRKILDAAKKLPPVNKP